MSSASRSTSKFHAFYRAAGRAGRRFGAGENALLVATYPVFDVDNEAAFALEGRLLARALRAHSSYRQAERLSTKPYALVGASLGGGAAARAAADAPRGAIERVVLLAHMPIATAEKIQGRKLFVVARHDTGSGDVPRLPRIRAQYERAAEPKKLVILDGAAHAQFIFHTKEGVRLMEEILRFLGKP